MAAYPDAKVILTTRDPVKWYHSVRGTIYELSMKTKGSILFEPFAKLIGVNQTMDLIDQITNYDKHGEIEGLLEVISKGEAHSVSFFNNWVEEVKSYVPADKLLVYEVKHGWGPLCEFLNVPIPDEPFPNVNDTATIKKYLRNATILSRLVFVGLPLVLFTATAIGYKFRHSISDFFTSKI